MSFKLFAKLYFYECTVSVSRDRSSHIPFAIHLASRSTSAAANTTVANTHGRLYYSRHPKSPGRSASLPHFNSPPDGSHLRIVHYQMILDTSSGIIPYITIPYHHPISPYHHHISPLHITILYHHITIPYHHHISPSHITVTISPSHITISPSHVTILYHHITIPGPIPDRGLERPCTCN